jgi:predicted Zn-dependent protease with MMP-like domain/Flp pilus assembly protein TadD
MTDKDRYWDCLDRAMEASHGGRTDDALAWLDEALRAQPNGAEAHNGRGEILWDEGRIDEAGYQFEMATQADPKFVTAHLNRVELLIEELGEHEQAIQYCDRLLAGRDPLARPDRSTEAELLYLKSKGLFYLDDLEGALFLVRRAIRVTPEVAVYRAFEGQICFELGRFEDSRRRLERAVALDGESAHAVYHLGLALERLEQDAEATRAFQQANALDPDHYMLPTTVDDATFERVASESLADLPRSIREYVEHVPVLIRDFPEAELVAQDHISPQVLGLFVGVPRTEAAVTAQSRDVDRVILYKKNLEKVCRTHAELVEQIQITVKHEIGHYLGLDEEDLERLGLA